MTPPAKPTALQQQHGIQFVGAFVTLIAVMLIVVSLTVRGTITPLEARYLWLLVVGTWIYAIAAQKEAPPDATK